jgi:sigma-B regulation protein RsbU (phosphoserine phosphatase)
MTTLNQGLADARDGKAKGEGEIRILIADDDRMQRHLLEVILSREGYRTIVAADGEEAITLALTGDPDLLLLDVMMPGKDGYQVCAQLKDDPRFADKPMIFLTSKADAGDRIRGLELGAVDYIGKPFNTREVLARVRTHIQIRILTEQLRHTNLELLERQKELERDLRAARDIQSSLLPRSRSIAEPWVKIDWRFEPCDSVGGDLFNVFWLDHENLAAYIVDVSGHGVPAAMVTVAVSRSLSVDSGCSMDRSYSGGSRITPPGEVLRRLDAEYPLERFGKFLTIVYMVLNCRTKVLRFSRAGHPPPLLVHANGAIETLSSGGTIIGIGGSVPFDEGAIQLELRDRLFLYTDGVVERENQNEEPFGHERMAGALHAARDESLLTACEHVTNQLAMFAQGVPSSDDVSLCGLEFQREITG